VRARIEALLRAHGVWSAGPDGADRSVPGAGVVANYCQGGEWPADPDGARLLATALVLDGVPAPPRLEAARAALAATLGGRGGAAAAAGAVPAAAIALRGVPASTVVRVAPLLLPRERA
jgi:hypothetical protein